MKLKNRFRNPKFEIRTTSNRNRLISYVLHFTLLASLFTLIVGCTNQELMFKESRVLMDTFCTITVVSPSKEQARDAINAGFAEIKKLETLLNYFSDDSEITSINKASGIKPVKVSKETLEIIKITLDIFKATNGAFDPTIAPVISQWNFSEKIKDRTVPLKSDINRALKLVDYNKVEINSAESTVYLKEKGMQLDLGGIAKGYGADKATLVIKSRGIKAALVAIAGDIRGYGLSASGNAWKVGVQNPRPDSASDKPWEDIFASIELKDRAISTSGDYQRFFIKDGRRYHHILDPLTGFPADTDLISASVIAPEGYVSDSMSTAVFILGAEKGLLLLESMGIEGVLVTQDKEIILTHNLNGKIEIINPDYQLLK